ncbi:MAG TPA: SDR family oxidoreductase [Burkholderiaceae bacterium]|nr:SDR family oxidoreductase [Burkholderiaceae bacterium]
MANQAEDFTGQVVLITGGGKGVGRGISLRFLEAGATVVICGRTLPDTLPQAGGRSAAFIMADVRDAEAVDALVSTILEQHGRLDVLVNNAGGTPYVLAAEGSARFHESMIRLNLLAPLLLAIRANAVMQKQVEGGVVVFIGTVGAFDARPGTATYAAAKAGVVSLARSLAVEWAPRVRVVSVSPGLVMTEQSHQHYGDAAGIAAVSATVPLGRMAEPVDIGDACVFMASRRASYVSGVDLLVHGGGEKPAFLDAANVNKT